MEEARSAYGEGIAARIDALEAARRLLGQKPAEAIAAMRRVAQSLRAPGAIPEVAEAARQVEEAPDEAIAAQVVALLQALQQVALDVESGQFDLLIVEDDLDLREMLAVRLARPNRQIHLAADVAEAEGVLDDHDVSLVVLDLGLPDIDGRELLVRLKGRPGAAEIPVVVLTGKGGDMPRTECLALGAEAFFEKPFDPRSLSAAVSATLKRLTEITLTSRLDPLTGLLNRAAFRDVYVRMQERASRSHEPLSVAILDLDSFKAVNDRHGHAMGDQVLQRTALVLTRFLRRSDAVARWGGEEFTLLLCADPEAACRAVEDALAGLRREEFAGAGGATFHVTFSAGVAPVHKTATLEEAIEVADRALYLAKAAGKDRVLRAEEAPDVGT